MLELHRLRAAVVDRAGYLPALYRLGPDRRSAPRRRGAHTLAPSRMGRLPRVARLAGVPMRRVDALVALAACGYHGDNGLWLRLYVENRVSYKNAQAAWAQGVRAREAGMTCGCWECRDEPLGVK